jgi:hypothetical protein
MEFPLRLMRLRILVSPRVAGCALALLLATACQTSQDMTVTREELELRAEARDDAPIVERLPMGTRVKVHDARFWENSDWHRIDTKGGIRWTKLDGLAPYPLRGETRFVRLEELPVHLTRDGAGSVTETLKLGDEVQLLAQDPAGAAEYRGVIRGGALRGYVDEFGLGPDKPLTRNLLASSHEWLKKGELERARQLARSAQLMAEGNGKSGALVEALTRAKEDPGSLKEELIGFGEKAASGLPPGKGSVGYVVPYRLAIREGADERDDVFTMLPVDAAVEVLEAKGQWAQVAVLAKSTPWMAVELGDLAKIDAGETAALSPAQRSGRTRGFVRLAALQVNHLSAPEQQAQANALSRENHPEERLEMLKRALSIARPEETAPAATALLDEAFQDEHYLLAVAAALRLQEAQHGSAPSPEGKGWKIESVASIYGCSGSPLESQIELIEFEPTGEYSKPTGNVCAIVTGLSSPCDVCLSDLTEYDSEERQHVLRDKVGVDAALTNHEQVITAYLKATSRLEDAFPRPSRIKVTVRTAAGPPPGRLFLFELPLEVERYETKLTSKPLFKEARISEVALPESATAGRWEYWMSTLQWEDSAHGALFSSDPKAAWATVKAFAKMIQDKPQELLTRNEEGALVYSLHLSAACGRCPNRHR